MKSFHLKACVRIFALALALSFSWEGRTANLGLGRAAAKMVTDDKGELTQLKGSVGITFSSSRRTVNSGESVVLTWSTTDASSCESSWGSVATNGSYNTGALSLSKSFWIRCSNGKGAVAEKNVHVIVIPPPGAVPVVPGLVGFGVTTPAGRGGAIIHVTNLNETGPGSLRACIDATGPRTCVFDTSGVIRLTQDSLLIRNPYITIAGQTAPAPGIMIRGSGLGVFRTHDVLIQHLQVRPGDLPEGRVYADRDAVHLQTYWGDPLYNVVVDHVSGGWSTDEAFSAWGDEASPIHDITFSHCLISEPLGETAKWQGSHAYGTLIGNNVSRLTFAHNLHAHCMGRGPRISIGTTDIVVVNNFSYRSNIWQNGKIQLTPNPNFPLADYPRFSVVGNVLIPSVGDRMKIVVYLSPEAPMTDLSVYVSDHLYDKTPQPGWDAVGGPSPLDSAWQAKTPPVWNAGLAVKPASEVEDYLTRCAGTRPAQRDAVDTRVINQVKTRTGADFIISQNEVGGFPVYAVNRRVFVPPADPNGDSDSDGYTNLEEVLHQMAVEVEGGCRE